MNRYKNIKHNRWVNIFLITVVSLLLNIVFSRLALYFKLPIYLDTVGTIIAGMLGGNFLAVIVGFFVNVINGLTDVTTLYYGIINILIGVFAAIFHKRKFFDRIGGIIAAIVVFSVIGGILGSLITYFLNGTNFGRVISAPLAIAIYGKFGFSKFVSQLLADILIDLLDKTVVVAVSIIVYRLIPKSYKWHTGIIFLLSPDPSSDSDEIPETHSVKRSLIRKVVVMVIIAEILLGSLASITGFILYRQVAISTYADLAEGVTKAASAVIDPDRIDAYLENGRNEEEYNRIESTLYSIKRSFPQTNYCYVYRFQEDGIHVVFDLDSETIKGNQPGDVIEIESDFFPYLPKLLKGEEVEEPFITNGRYGHLLTVLRALKNSEGKTVAYVAADVTMEKIAADESRFVVKLLSMFFGLSVIIMCIILEFVNRGVVYPVNRMASASVKFAYKFEQDGESAFKFMESLKIHTFDEIEHLYKSLLKMCSDLLNYIRQVSSQTKRITRMQDEIIINFAEMVEARDISTGNHIKKTAFYVEGIARELRKNGKFADILTDEYIDKLKRSAPLHDIGKIAVPDSILNKPGKLTEEEFEIMKIHSAEGKKILKKIEANASDSMDDDYLKESIDMAFYHHEKWDGTGYPNGLKGEEIPLSARIMAVADVFDALVAERVYKKPFPYEKSLNIILEGAGKAFDPVIVEAFSHIAKELYDKRTMLKK